MRRQRKIPWVLRHCPEKKRGVAVLVFTFAGLIAQLIFFVAGLLGFLLAPLFMAAQHPDAPIAVPMRWLREYFSHDSAIFIYVVVQLVIVSILTYAMIVYDYLRYDASEKSKSEVV
jgi:purine-cytosine permease-like protein